jgi:hypothetical protein
MSILECSLAVEREMGGKPFTVCTVETWFYIGVGMLEHKKPDQLKAEAARLYDTFGDGKDSSERGVTLEELKEIASNGGIRIIPKTKDGFIRMDEWEKKLEQST